MVAGWALAGAAGAALVVGSGRVKSDLTLAGGGLTPTETPPLQGVRV